MNKTLLIVLGIIIIIGLFWIFSADTSDDVIPSLENGEEAAEMEDTKIPPVNESGDETGDETAAAEHSVSYTNDGFTPSSVTVSAGDTVVFENNSSANLWVASDPHPVHTDLPAFDAQSGIASGATYEFTFTQVGEWGFHNHLVPTHGGTVIVE